MVSLDIRWLGQLALYCTIGPALGSLPGYLVALVELPGYGVLLLKKPT